jgi:hypothetical protein
MASRRVNQTTVNIHTRLKEYSLRKAAADKATVFKEKMETKQIKRGTCGGKTRG